MSTLAKTVVDERDYLSMMAGGEGRFEFFEGAMIAREAGGVAHTAIQFNLAGIVWGQIRETEFRGAIGDLLVLDEASRHYMLPDCVVFSKEARVTASPAPVLLEPLVVIEIVSPRTETRDRTSKFASYSRLGVLRHLVLVQQDYRLVEHFYRESSKEPWKFEHAFAADAVVELAGIGLKIALEDLYRDVKGFC